MKKHYFAFMQKILDNGHAEPVPPSEVVKSKPCWFLPHFGVYHPQKPNKIRVVFDAAAEINGISLNKLLPSGPDFTNSLLGVLLRFRQNPTAFMADIEQMFHSFVVKEEHRDFLRFLWYKRNDLDGEVIEYRMRVHLFGNTSSPAVATVGLRKTAQVGRPNSDPMLENSWSGISTLMMDLNPHLEVSSRSTYFNAPKECWRQRTCVFTRSPQTMQT
jgi:hypothetical protein